MIKKVMLAALAAGALALNAPVAYADAPAFDCGFDSNKQEDVTGQNYEGAIYGYVAHAGDSGISIDCYVTVNGTRVGGASASGDNFVVAGDRLTFAAEDTDDVKLCYTVTTDHGTQTGCFETTHTQIPPQAVIDLIDQAIDAVNSVLILIDPTICPVIGNAAGDYGPISIASNGNISVDGEIWYICP